VHVQPLHDWIVVKLDDIRETTASGLLHLPQGAGAERVRTGTVLRVGPGKRHWNRKEKREILVPVAVGPGAKVAFWRENLEHQQGKQMSAIIQELEPGTGMIREADILYVEEKSDG
jgi:co-chaperonin GroES (HSP10)